MSTQAEIKQLSTQLKKALHITSGKYSYDKDLIPIILLRDPKLHLSEAQFSKYKKAYKDVAYNSFKRLIAVIDAILLEEFNFKWDKTLNAYSQTPEQVSHQINLTLTDKKIDGLIGTWIALSYNVLFSESEGKDYYHYFKFKIINADTVLCQTKRANYSKGSVRIVGSDRIVIEINNDDRAIFLAGYLGKSNDLNRFQILRLGYVDTGAVHVKSGFAILIRTEQQFEKIHVENLEGSDIRLNGFQHHLNLLRTFKQIVVPSSDEY